MLFFAKRCLLAVAGLGKQAGACSFCGAVCVGGGSWGVSWRRHVAFANQRLLAVTAVGKQAESRAVCKAASVSKCNVSCAGRRLLAEKNASCAKQHLFAANFAVNLPKKNTALVRAVPWFKSC